MQACRKAAGALASTSLPTAEALRGALPAVAQRFYHKNVRTYGLVACGTQGRHDYILRICHSAAEALNRAESAARMPADVCEASALATEPALACNMLTGSLWRDSGVSLSFTSAEFVRVQSA